MPYLLFLLLLVFSGCQSSQNQTSQVDFNVPEGKIGVYLFLTKGKNTSHKYKIIYKKLLSQNLVLNDYTFFLIDEGEDEICLHTTQGTVEAIPLEDYKAGETLLLEFSLGNYQINHIDNDTADLYKSKLSYRPPNFIEQERFDSQYTPVSMLYQDLMIVDKKRTLLNPDSEHAIVNFYRSSNFLKNHQADIWSDEKFLGSLKGESFIQVKIKPGKVNFYCGFAKLLILESELLANKTYNVHLQFGKGPYSLPVVDIIPVNPNTEATESKWKSEQRQIVDQKKIDRWNKELTLVKLNHSALNKIPASRFKKSQLFYEYLNKIHPENLKQTQTLPKEYGF